MNLYHGTTLKNWKKIKIQGLKVKKGKYNKLIFLTNDYTCAMDNYKVVLKINSKTLCVYGNYRCIPYNKDIPIKYIKRIK